MSHSILEEAAAGRAVIQRWTVEQYHRAIDSGFIPETNAYELLDGFIVRKDRAHAGENLMTIGDRHSLVVQRFVRLASQFDALGCHLRIQQPIVCTPVNEPEPDASVVRGMEDDYSDRKPQAADTLCVIEVADSSLSRDLGLKLQIYSKGGIPQYVVIDLVHNLVLDYRNPNADGYQETVTLRAGDELRLSTSATEYVRIPVTRLLP